IPEILRRVEQDSIRSLFLAPTVWVPLASHPDLETRDLSSLRKAQYGASIMPVTVLQRLRSRYPDLGFYNCFGQSEIGPLACVLRPEEHDSRPDRKSTRLNSSHVSSSYAVFCLKKKNNTIQ